MINILICEDNPLELNEIANIIDNYILFQNKPANVALKTKKPNAILDYIEKNSSTKGLYFLDIDLHSKLNGFQLASEIRLLDPRGYIVFVTSHSEMMPMAFAYKIEAMDFILKDNISTFSKQVKDCIDEAIKRDSCFSALQGYPCVKLKICSQTVNLDTSEIITVKTTDLPHRILIITTTDTKRTYGSIKEWLALLPTSYFISCSSSEIINKRFIEHIDYRERMIYLTNGVIAPISRCYQKYFPKDAP